MNPLATYFSEDLMYASLKCKPNYSRGTCTMSLSSWQRVITTSVNIHVVKYTNKSVYFCIQILLAFCQFWTNYLVFKMFSFFYPIWVFASGLICWTGNNHFYNSANCWYIAHESKYTLYTLSIYLKK